MTASSTPEELPMSLTGVTVEDHQKVQTRSGPAAPAAAPPRDTQFLTLGQQILLFRHYQDLRRTTLAVISMMTLGLLGCVLLLFYLLLRWKSPEPEQGSNGPP